MNISKPTILINEKQCRENIAIMAKKAEKHNLIFRPHFKTHQSARIGEWFREAGIDSITVSSVEMAEYFADHGWKKISIAFPFNKLEIDSINRLAEIVELNLLILTENSITFLENNLTSKVGIFLEIDTGYHRSGIHYNKKEQIFQILERIKNDKLVFKGFLTHSGHSYQSESPEQILSIHQDTLLKMKELKSIFAQKHPDLIISIGDTPSCSLADNFEGIDEIRPGNFIFYDMMQYNLSSCNFEQISLAVACPVVALYPERDEIIIYGGAVHLSKEFIFVDEKQTYGFVTEPKGDHWGDPIPDMFIKSLSQEHGIIKVQSEQMSKYEIGDILIVLPIHSCLTMNLLHHSLRIT